MDIKNFYLCIPMMWHEYMQLKLSNISEDLIAHYHLLNIATPNSYIYCEICQGMYRFPQAGSLPRSSRQKG